MIDVAFQYRLPHVVGTWLTLAAVTGCSVSHDLELVDLMACGAYGTARTRMERIVAHRGTESPEHGEIDRQEVLDHMRRVVATLADGYVSGQDNSVLTLFDLMRRQGLNRDRTTAAVILHEGVRLWKGEPFEQAMAYHYVALHHALQNQWGNARAASDNALFHLRDFGLNGQGQTATTEDLIQRTLNDPDYLERGYVTVPSNFVPAHLMLAVAALRMGRTEEADDHLDHVVGLNASFASLVQHLRDPSCNTLLIVEHGFGPAKIATGPDGAIASFIPRTPSDDVSLQVAWGTAETAITYPVACDLNRMARHHMWRNLEDVRLAKSAIGTLLMGAGVLIAGSHDENEAAQWIGTGMVLAGAAARSGAGADTRYCEILPQRVYFAPMSWPQGEDFVQLRIEGLSAARFDVSALRDPGEQGFRVGYVRMIATGAAPSWAAASRVLYANDATPDAVPSRLPYILGGNCVRKPTPQMLEAYWKNGLPRSVTLPELEAIYRDEGIALEPHGARPIGRHLLEGGRSLAGPEAGTAGFARLYRRTHSPYQPRHERVRELASQLRGRGVVRHHE